jgi:Family of unknown function (DUF6152)
VKRRSLLVLMLTAAISFSLPLFAHHGNAALDMSKKLVLKGVVTDWRWQNPHSILKFDVKDDSGNVVNWSAEINNPADMVERGWTAHSIKIGDQITITVNPVKSGKPVGRIVQVVFPDGRTLNTQYVNQQQ